MMFVKIPFKINNGFIESENNIEKSINQFLKLLVSSHYGSFSPDYNFGFGFKNFRFENFDEKKGTIMNYKNSPDIINEADYKKKISDTSQNINNFAYDLKKSIDKYEPRLRNVRVTMQYKPEFKTIYLKIKGEIVTEKLANYVQDISFRVW
jgi:hypothetical protein